LFKHFVIPESQHRESGGAQKRISLAVSMTVNMISMLTAVELDGQMRFQTHEVEDVAAEWMLAAELPSVELTVAQSGPQTLLGAGQVGAELAWQAVLLCFLIRLSLHGLAPR
jgi:hypothetical protein